MKTVSSVLALVGLTLAAAGPAEPAFPGDWTAIVTSAIAIDQGGSPGANGAICCDATSPECKVQTEYQAVKQYYDVTNQMMKLGNGDGSGVVYLFKDMKAYEVAANGDCQGYCPIPKGQDSLEPIGMAPNSTYEGSATGNKWCGGNDCVEWENSQDPFFNITFQTNEWFVSTTSPPTPYAIYTTITPFGIQMGTQDQTWEQWVTGTPDPSVFKVVNATECPMSNNCGGGSGSGHGSGGSGYGPSAFSSQRVSFIPPFFGVPEGDVLSRTAIKRNSPISPAARITPEMLDLAADYLESLPTNHPTRALMGL